MPKEIKFLDNILRKEEMQSDPFNETKRRYSISRSGRFKSKNKQRETLDMNLFSGQNNVEKNQNHHTTSCNKHNKDHVQHHSKEMVASG